MSSHRPHRGSAHAALLAALLVTLAGCGAGARIDPGTPAVSAAVDPAPPVAEMRHHEVVAPHGHARTDEYYWLRDREDPAVIAYLEAENAYAEAVMAGTEELQERVFQEIRGRIQETDMSVPVRRGDYWYYTRFEEGQDHPIHARKHGSLDAPEEILLDANERAEGKRFYRVMTQVSSGHDLLAFAEDTLGRNIVTLRFKDLRTGALLDDVIDHVTWNMAWAEDNRTLLFARQDPTTLRSYRIYRHRLGDDPAAAQLVYEETDETFRTFVFKTRSRDYLVIGSSHTLTDEFRVLPADRPDGELRVFLPRERGHEHSIDHIGGHFYIRTNDGARNFRLMRTPVDRTAREHWEEVIPHRDDVFLARFDVFRDHLVLSERRDGMTQLRVRGWDGQDDHYVRFDEEAYTVRATANPEVDTNVLRLAYESLATPGSIYDYDMETRELTLLKREEVLGGYDPADYRTERFMATARDGSRVPVSLVYRRDLRQDGPQPLLLAGYGSYGASRDPTFSSIRLSLLDRGFAYAIAHIRGGQEMGRDWYEDGKLLNKRNTFYDFIDVAEHLVARGYTAPDRLYAQGGSAGGLLMGAVVNLRPDLFHGAIAAVPFVDVVTTMLDESIPLTTFEWDEWGDPREPEYYEYMLSYSPYDNITAQPYPNLLVTAGLHDSQVQYWEAAKWVARLRRHHTGDERILLRTNLDAGHGGAAGRYQRWREIAFEYAFLLDLAGLGEVEPRGASGAVAAGAGAGDAPGAVAVGAGGMNGAADAPGDAGGR
jgi:oligopeptidase B